MLCLRVSVAYSLTALDDGHIQKYSFSQDGVSISQFTKLCHPEGDPFVEISDQAALTSM
jgi:hypothetical protein